MKQNRFKSKIFWMGILSIFMLIMSQFNLYSKLGITSDFVKTLFDLSWSTIAVVSVGNSPTLKDEY